MTRPKLVRWLAAATVLAALSNASKAQEPAPSPNDAKYSYAPPAPAPAELTPKAMRAQQEIALRKAILASQRISGEYRLRPTVGLQLYYPNYMYAKGVHGYVRYIPYSYYHAY